MQLPFDLSLADSLVAQIGLWRSRLIYHGIPLRRRRITRFYAQFIRPDDLVFDVGAHVGNHIQPLIDNGATVVAIEPQPTCMRYLRAKYGNDKRVILIDAALGKMDGEDTLFISQRTPTVTTLSRQWQNEVAKARSFTNVRWDRTIDVNVTTLDTLIKRFGRPHFCKIDVEGFELEVLRGLSTALPFLSFEYIPAAKDIGLGCLLQLSQLGEYQYNWSTGESYTLCEPLWISESEMASVIAKLKKEGKSGDIYAKLIRPLCDRGTYSPAPIQ